MRIASLATAVSLLLLFGNRSAAYAEPIFYAVASSDARDRSGHVADVDFQPSSDTAGPVQSQLADGSAIAASSVIDGVLHASAASTLWEAHANGSASFFDTLLIQSSILPAGSFVHLTAELVFSRTFTPAPSEGCGGNESGVAYARLDASINGFLTDSLFLQDHTCDGENTDFASRNFIGIVGEELTINFVLDAQASFLTIDASSHFFLTQWEDSSYATASGNSYARDFLPVPEPSSLFLIASGISFVVFRAHRQTVRK